MKTNELNESLDSKTAERLMKHYVHFKELTKFHHKHCTSANAGQSPIPVASGEELKEVIKFLVDYDKSINEETIHDVKCEAHLITPLSNAIRFNHSDIVKIILENGGSMKFPEFLKTTALHMAILGHKNTEIIELLLKNGFEIDIMDQTNRTPLTLAICRRYNNVAKLLIKYGANVNGQGLESGNSPLLLAMLLRNYSVTELLLIYGADVNVNANSHFATPLTCAIMNNYPVEYIRLLLLYGADVGCTFPTPHSQPLLYHAIERKSIIIDILITNGSQSLKRIKNEDGDNALEYALKCALTFDVSSAKFLIYNVNKS